MENLTIEQVANKIATTKTDATKSNLMWIDRNKQLPSENRKFIVMIKDSEGNLSESYCSFSVKKQKFHFDMIHINWEVVAWVNHDKYSL